MANDIAEEFHTRAGHKLEKLYGEHQADILIDELVSLLQHHVAQNRSCRRQRWDQRDAILITYGDSILAPEIAPLQALARFLRQNLRDLISTVHILPFFPFSSDDGFSVIDYTTVNPELGDWDDIERIGEHFDLMIDLVINHVSRESLWFIDFINQRPPACYYFWEIDPGIDLSEVVRPRKSNLLTPVHTHQGLKYVWSTFSEDQIDVNFGNPNVMREFVRILLLYLSRGGRFIRLDAIAYLWKKLGTGCINLPETHDIVKVLRIIMELVAPSSVLLTETNVPKEQNRSYFGDGDEAHMVYHFSLAPLMLHALHHGRSRFLNDWARTSFDAPAGCTYLNFTASHDGIGMRPAEGLLPQVEIDSLIEMMRRFGGFVSMKSNPDGRDTPYEINITYFDALKGTARGADQWQVPRFLCSQAIMLGLRGIPALYIQSLLASPNDLAGMEKTGRLRSINRRKWPLDEIENLLSSPGTPNEIVFNELKRMLMIRQKEKPFHPDAAQEVVELGEDFFAFRRHDESEEIVCVSNLTDRPARVRLPEALNGCNRFDLIADADVADIEICFQPYQTMWLKKV